ncbi:hypothetical protein LPJ78_003922 [Coemansia sp. RSA 989]|nr:hypothetical protein BX667DRAFT_502990 [Coemansia mojavensis]KAJ1863597.1 hypothetical protein LPJ78_003922 [Coemansia sp. RSA 989]KAJ2647195.1 hypothetical protein IWW40_004877 [Coemansia sp. RSA 1250]KAJ2672122.1 hypothetical protein IWW42_003027 [Coemansia sp. RSA 1085]
MSRRQSAGDAEPVAAHARSRSRRWSIGDLFFRPQHSTPVPSDEAHPQLGQKRPTLTRRRSSPETSAHPPAESKPLRNEHRPHPRRIHVDLHDSSDVWMRRPTKDKLSLNPVRPRMLFRGVELPQFLKIFSSHANSDAERSKSHKSKKKHTRPRSLKRRPRNRHSAANPPEQVAMPVPQVFESASQAVRFSEPLSVPERERRSPPPRMPIPAHFTTQAAADGTQEQTGTSDHLQPNHQPSNRVSVASVDDENHAARVFQVLERRNTGRSHKASQPSDAASPVLVTITRGGSIVSEPTSKHSSEQTQSTDVTKKRRSRHVVDRASSVSTRASKRAYSPNTSPASLGMHSSQGTESFVTAPMFPSTQPSEEPPEHLSELPVSGQPRRRQSDEVSDIAMRKHLLVGDDMPSHITETQMLADWPHAHDAARQHSIAQTISQAPQATAQPAANPAGVVNVLSSQRHYSPPLDAHSANVRSTGSEQTGLLEGLLIRVADLESQFTCIEAVMANIEDKLSGLSVVPSRSLSIRRPTKPTAGAGLTPAVKTAFTAHDPAFTETIGYAPRAETATPLSSTVPASTETDMSCAAAFSQHKHKENPIRAAEAAATKLVDIVGHSRLAFNAATSDALSTIANLLTDIKALESERRKSA